MSRENFMGLQLNCTIGLRKHNQGDRRCLWNPGATTTERGLSLRDTRKVMLKMVANWNGGDSDQRDTGENCYLFCKFCYLTMPIKDHQPVIVCVTRPGVPHISTLD